MLKDTISDEDRCEITTAIASDRCKELRESMRPKKGGETPPDDAFDPSDIGEVMRAFVEALPEKEDLPDGLCEDMAVVSNSSALLGRDLGPEIDSHRVVVRFNEYARVGLDNFERHVGRRTTCHVVSEQVIAEFMEDEKMLEALRKTPMTLWMPPMAWGGTRQRTVGTFVSCSPTRRRTGLSSRSANGDRWCCFARRFPSQCGSTSGRTAIGLRTLMVTRWTRTTPMRRGGGPSRAQLASNFVCSPWAYRTTCVSTGSRTTRETKSTQGGATTSTPNTLKRRHMTSRGSE